MSLSHPIEELNRRLAERLTQALADARGRLGERLRVALESELARAGAEAAVAPEAWVSEETFAGRERAAQASGREEALAELAAAVRAIDSGASQVEILRALLAAALRHADRAALLLADRDGARGWVALSAAGEAAIANLAFAWEDSPGLALLAAGRGGVELSREECRRLGALFDHAGEAEEGLLVPLVLRDRIAAALYADRAPGRPNLAAAALQLLALSAAQAIELLAFRQRDTTPTLHLARERSATAPGLALWDPSDVAEVPEVAPSAGAAPAVAEPVGFEMVEKQPVPAPTVAPEPAETAAWQLAEIAPAAAPEPVAQAVWGEPVFEAPSAEEPVYEFAEEAAPPPEPEPAAAAEPAWQEEGTVFAGEVVAAAPPAVIDEETTPLELPTAILPIPPAAVSPWGVPAVEPSEDETVMIRRPPLDAAAPASPFATTPTAAPLPPAAAPTEVRPPVRGGEVLPPPDLQGPGWAFTGGRAASPTGDEGLHDEARRLARLLVSEIKLYNEEQVEEGRRTRDIYRRLKDDIDRSRQLYDERVHERVRASTDYFKQELIRNLAGGDTQALGM